MADPTVSGLVSKLLDNTKEFVDDLLENVEKLESDVTDMAKDTKDSSIEALRARSKSWNEQIEKLAKVKDKNVKKTTAKK
jgi:outer membrane murein-binding lipoprotein Lpp